MRASWVVLGMVLAACGSDRVPVDTGLPDGSTMDASMDAVADTGGGDTNVEDGAIADGTVEDTSPPDARPDATDCDPSCPEGYCVDGMCVLSCCETGYCPAGSTCDFRSCGCVPATGCCAGEACAVGEICSWDCTCASEDDCCHFGCRGTDPAVICLPDCTCGPDPTCGTCPADTFCARGECLPRCFLEGCADPLDVCGPSGCTPPLCSDVECLALDLRCDPGRGCFDPCADGDWTWCTSAGGTCWLGSCVDPSCAPGGVSCSFHYDCCGNAVCQPDDAAEPFCPTPCRGDPYVPIRGDLCVCALGGWCEDLNGGLRPPRPPPFP